MHEGPYDATRVYPLTVQILQGLFFARSDERKQLTGVSIYRVGYVNQRICLRYCWRVQPYVSQSIS